MIVVTTSGERQRAEPGTSRGNVNKDHSQSKTFDTHALELTPPQNPRNDRHVTTTLRAAYFACHTLLTHNRPWTLDLRNVLEPTR